jgi:DNA-binding NarL/FixJ family response regulator
MSSARLLIADDHEILRRGLRACFEKQSNWKVVAEACDGASAVQEANRCKPDVAVLDFSMPRLNGLEATGEILKSLPKTKILILTVHSSDELIRQMLMSGARGYLLKSDHEAELVRAVSALIHNKTFFTREVSELITEGYLRKLKRFDLAPHSRLTPRQFEIVRLLASGKKGRDIAQILGMKAKTVDAHRANIMRRTNCHSVAALVRYAVRNQIIV